MYPWKGIKLSFIEPQNWVSGIKIILFSHFLIENTDLDWQFPKFPNF